MKNLLIGAIIMVAVTLCMTSHVLVQAEEKPIFGSGRTVLTYVKLDFQGKWKYNGEKYSFRPVNESAVLLVVTEAPKGQLITHHFTVRRRQEDPNGRNPTDNVIVPITENIVYIPERCVKKDDGDTTVCSNDDAD